MYSGGPKRVHNDHSDIDLEIILIADPPPVIIEWSVLCSQGAQRSRPNFNNAGGLITGGRD